MIKVVIFDFDDTLYSNLAWEGWEEFLLKNFKKIFSKISQNDFEKTLKKYDFDKTHKLIEQFAKVLISEIDTSKPLVDFLKTVKFETDWKNAKIVSSEVLKKLNKEYKLYIVSNSSNQMVQFACKNLDIDLSFFKKIYQNNFLKSDPSKKVYYKKIMKLEDVLPSEVLVIGDSEDFDLKPAKDLNMRAYLIKNCEIPSYFI